MNIIIFRGIWYELWMLTCGLYTLFGFVEVVADKPEVLIKKKGGVKWQIKIKY